MTVSQVAFPELLSAFSVAVAANDGPGLAAMFTPDGTYVDEFFGTYQGAGAIIAMLQRFHDTGRDYHWDFTHPVTDGTTGYARFCFSFTSRLPGCEGRPVTIHGISQFQFNGGLISRYSEAFDRGVALVQLGFPAERIRRIVEKAAAAK